MVPTLLLHKTRVSDPDPDLHVFALPDPDPHKFADPDPGKKVRKWMNKLLFCRVGDVQCKQFHFFCSDFKHPLLRIIWNVKKTKKNSFFPFTPSPLPRIPPGSGAGAGSGSAWRFLPGSGSAKKMRIRNPGMRERASYRDASHLNIFFFNLAFL